MISNLPTPVSLAAIAEPTASWRWISAVFSIVIIDVVLAGDNAVVIALAVRQLPSRQRLVGMVLGAGFAVALRIVLTYFAAQLLMINYLKLVGGAIILWIAIKLLRENTSNDDPREGKGASGLLSAVWLILVADITMSTDNVLGVAAAAKGSLTLLLLGLGLSIPLVVFASNLISKLMDTYPFIVWIGAAVLGRVGGEMIMTDHVFYSESSGNHPWAVQGVAAFAAAFTLACGFWHRRTKQQFERIRGKSN